jgi:hypothetical protein
VYKRQQLDNKNYKKYNDILFNINSYFFFTILGLAMLSHVNYIIMIIVVCLSLIVVALQIILYNILDTQSSLLVCICIVIFNIILTIIMIGYIIYQQTNLKS